MRAIIFGDSIVGQDADSVGGLSAVLIPMLEREGIEATAVGIRGSQLWHWVDTLNGPGNLGRWNPTHARAIPEEKRKQANLKNLASDNADLYWINLGTNDAIAGRSVKGFVERANSVLNALPKSAIKIWTVGNASEGNKYLASLQQSQPDLLILPFGHQSPVDLHPSQSRHKVWLKRNWPEVMNAVTRYKIRYQWQLAASVGAAILTAGFLFWITRP